MKPMQNTKERNIYTSKILSNCLTVKQCSRKSKSALETLRNKLGTFLRKNVMFSNMMSVLLMSKTSNEVSLRGMLVLRVIFDNASMSV